MAAAKKLLIDRFVTRPAIGRRHLSVDFEAVMRFRFLPFRRAMALQAAHMLLRMFAQFVFMDDRILLIGMAFRTFAGCPHQRGRRLVDHRRWTARMQSEGSDDEYTRDRQSDEHESKIHG